MVAKRGRITSLDITSIPALDLQFPICYPATLNAEALQKINIAFAVVLA